MAIYSGMNEAANYEVALGRIARTLVYTDPEGAIVFTFDASVSKDERTGKWRVSLDSRPMVDGKCFEPKTGTGKDRVVAAIERSRRYLEDCGYLVEVTN